LSASETTYALNVKEHGQAGRRDETRRWGWRTESGKAVKRVEPVRFRGHRRLVGLQAARLVFPATLMLQTDKPPVAGLRGQADALDSFSLLVLSPYTHPSALLQHCRQVCRFVRLA
jgi:hypothetical protein